MTKNEGFVVLANILHRWQPLMWCLLLVSVVTFLRVFLKNRWEKRWVRRIRTWTKKFLEDSWWITLGLPLIPAAGPALLAWAKHPGAEPTRLAEWFNGYLKDHSVLAQTLLWTSVIAVILNFVVARLREVLKERNKLSERQAGVLMEMFDEVVGIKVRRFGESARRIRDSITKVEVNDAFAEITQPKLQMCQLVRGIYGYFSAEVLPGETLQVLLVRMENNEPAEVAECIPSNTYPKTPMKDLKGKYSAMHRAARDNSMLIIPDIEAEVGRKSKKRYAPGGPGSSNTGSILCFPVRHHELDENPYVISVRVTAVNALKPADRARYELVLKRFADRLVIEHSLAVIKKATT